MSSGRSIGNLPGTPSSWIANVALQEQLQTGKFHLLPGGHGPDPLSGSGSMGRARKSRPEGRGSYPKQPLIQVARSFAAEPLEIVTRVVLPAIRPSLLASIRVTVGLAPALAI
jgi:hypothetical protein